MTAVLCELPPPFAYGVIMSLAALTALLRTHGLEKRAAQLHEEELSLETLKWMASDSEAEFIASLKEVGLDEEEAAKLHAALVALSSAAAGDGNAAAPVTADVSKAAAPAAVDDALTALLRTHGLEKHAAQLHEEELSLETLTWMASDSEAECITSLTEVGLDNDEAVKLHVALIASSATPRDTSAGQPSPPPPPPVPSASGLSPLPAPTEPPASTEAAAEHLQLVGKRVLIQGLNGRKDLNGRCGTVLFRDATSGRLTVNTEARTAAEEIVTVALKPANVDAHRAKAIPMPRPKPTAESHRQLDEAAAKAASAALAKHAETTLESKERVDAYARAANWKKPAEPGSIEHFWKEKNRKKREEEEAKLAAWKASNQKAAAQMAESQRKAREGVRYSQSGAAAGRGGAPAELGKAAPEIAEAAVATLPSAEAELVQAEERVAAQAAADPSLAAALAALRTARGPVAAGTDQLAAALGKVATAASPASDAAVRSSAGVPSRPAGTASAAALEAYKRHHYDASDAAATLSDLAMAEGTVSHEVRNARQRAQAERAEARYRDKHAFVGEHYNDI